MSFLDRFLLRLGLVRLKRYGLAVGADGRLVSGPELANDTWGDQYLPPAPVVDLLRPDPPPHRLARGSNPPPIPGSVRKSSQSEGRSPRDLTVLSLAPTQPALPEITAPLITPKPIPAAVFSPSDTVDDELTVRPDATPIRPTPVPMVSESKQWEAALVRAKATTEPADDVGKPDADEEWEWKLAMARAKAETSASEPTVEFERPDTLADGSGPTPLMEATTKPKRASRSKKALSYIQRKTSDERDTKPLPSIRKRRDS